MQIFHLDESYIDQASTKAKRLIWLIPDEMLCEGMDREVIICTVHQIIGSSSTSSGRPVFNDEV